MPMTCALSRRNHPLRRWKILFVTTPFYAVSHIRANPEKTQISSTFHLKTRDAQQELKVVWHDKPLAYSHKRVYLGVTLDRSIAYKDHIAKTKAKNRSYEEHPREGGEHQQLGNWGTDARTIRTTALALCFFSSSE